MSINVSIFFPELLHAMHDPGKVAVNGTTVGECLQDLVRQYPAAEGLLFNSQGKVQKRLNIFVNAESLLKTEITKPVKEGDTLIIAVLVGGG
jgi:hypothetical protein